MLEVYYTERWYNMDIFVVSTVGLIILYICKTQQDAHYEDKLLEALMLWLDCVCGAPVNHTK
jgi:hypothetical protein